MKSTGTSGRVSASASLSSRPLSPGMMTSLRPARARFGIAATSSSACRPFSASATVSPTPSSERRTRLRTAASSSTTSTTADSSAPRPLGHRGFDDGVAHGVGAGAAGR